MPTDYGNVDKRLLVTALTAYNQEAEDGRRERDIVWRSNWDAYWQRYDFSKKLPHQFKVIMPEATQFIERFAAALKESLTRAGDWFEVKGPAGIDDQVAPLVKGVVQYWLDRAGDWVADSAKDFYALFEEMVKDGALMTMAASVTWREVEKTEITLVDQTNYEMLDGASNETQAQAMGRRTRTVGVVAVEPLDPRTIWYDPTGRRLYRRRRIELDLHELRKMALQLDAKGQAVWNAEEIDKLSSFVDHKRETERRESSNQPTEARSTGRKPVVLDEYLGTFLDSDGTVLCENCLVVMANEVAIVRGPEPNPYLHGQDWVISTPMVRVRGAVYGRSYVEPWTSLINSLTEFVNLMLDASYRHSLPITAGDPDALLDPDQLKQGLVGGMHLLLEGGALPEQALSTIEIGNLKPELLNALTFLKTEAQEGAVLNDLLLGNLPQTGERTATEITQASQSGNAYIASIASTIEHNFLAPLLQRIWTTALQHMDFRDYPDLAQYIPPELQPILLMDPVARLQLLAGGMEFKVGGITSVMARELKRQQLLAAWQVILGSRDLAQHLIPVLNIFKMLDMVFRGFGLDPGELILKQQVPQQMANAQQGAANEATPPPQPGAPQ